MKAHFQRELDSIKQSGLFKEEWEIDSPQGVRIIVGGREVLNFCANNYLGLANDETLKTAAKEAIDKWGVGVASVRFICGTQVPHLDLEGKISEFLRTEATILYSSCAAANEGLFETLFGFEDAIISDQLNHATIIRAIWLWLYAHKRKTEDSKVEFPISRIFRHLDMADLEKHLQETQGKRFRVIVTDGVFSMDGDIANLKTICELAEKYRALVVVDDSHATGFLGPKGRGTPEYWGVMDRVDVITSTFGKALGGATGGFTSGRKEIIDILRQKSPPYLFSNSEAPSIVGTGLKALEIASENTSLRDKLEENTLYFRVKMAELGFAIRPGLHPIVPIMLYDAPKAVEMAKRLLDEGIYVKAFSYPVVPKDKARIRVQLSAAHEKADLDFALEKFAKVGRELGIIK